MIMGETTTIPLSKATRNRLKSLGRKGETYDHILQKLIEMAEQRDFINRQERILKEEEFVPLDQV